MVLIRRVALAIAIAFFAGCSKPPLWVEYDKGLVVLNLQTLGEYPSEVSRLVLTECETEVVLWQVEAAEGSPQIWRITLSAGENASDLNDTAVGGRYQVMVPAAGQPVVLSAGTSYCVKAWGKEGRHAGATFALE